ncbi:MAG: hypothetical protein ACYC27_16230 [Armatimonadota bacterium]
MIRSIYKFRFCKMVSSEGIENALLLTILAAESLHGRSGLRLDAEFCLDKRARTFIINAENQVGCDIARMFTGFLKRAIGEENFSVRLSEGRIPVLPHYRVDGIEG